MSAKISRQRTAQLRAIARGMCAQFCGRPRQATNQRCRECQIRASASKRRRMGCMPWRPGGPGRPPMEEQEAS
jgi:hypothetical protein